MLRRTALIALGGTAFAGIGRIAAAQPPAPVGELIAAFSPDVQALFGMRESAIDTGRAALHFAKEIYPAIDVETLSRQIDGMALEAGQFLRRYASNGDPERVVRALNTYYYKEWGARYANAGVAQGPQPTFFLHHTLATKEGNCVTLPMLYMAVAQRLGFSVFGVLEPDHTFLRFVDARLKEQNIELTSGAGYEPDAGYAQRLNISPQGIRSGAYLRTLTRREYLGVMIQQNALAFSERRLKLRATRYFEFAAQLDPRNVYFPRNLAALWMQKAQATGSAQMAHEYKAVADRYMQQAMSMGWVRDPDANTRRTSR